MSIKRLHIVPGLFKKLPKVRVTEERPSRPVGRIEFKFEKDWELQLWSSYDTLCQANLKHFEFTLRLNGRLRFKSFKTYQLSKGIMGGVAKMIASCSLIFDES